MCPGGAVRELLLERIPHHGRLTLRRGSHGRWTAARGRQRSHHRRRDHSRRPARRLDVRRQRTAIGQLDRLSGLGGPRPAGNSTGRVALRHRGQRSRGVFPRGRLFPSPAAGPPRGRRRFGRRQSHRTAGPRCRRPCQRGDWRARDGRRRGGDPLRRPDHGRLPDRRPDGAVSQCRAVREHGCGRPGTDPRGGGDWGLWLRLHDGPRPASAVRATGPRRIGR